MAYGHVNINSFRTPKAELSNPLTGGQLVRRTVTIKGADMKKILMKMILLYLPLRNCAAHIETSLKIHLSEVRFLHWQESQTFHTAKSSLICPLKQET